MKTASSTDLGRCVETGCLWFNPRCTLLLRDAVTSLEFWISWRDLTSSRYLTAAEAVHRTCITEIRRTFRAPDLPHSSKFCRCHTLCSHLLQAKLLLDKLKESSIFHFPQLVHFFEVFAMKIGRPSDLPLVLIVLCPLLDSRDGDRVICSAHVFLLVVGYWCKTLAWIFFVFNNWCCWRYRISKCRRVSATVTPDSPSRPTQLSSR